MAVTKIHAIKLTLGKAIDYICNEHKTDESVLISSFGCAPETADIEFKYVLSHTKEKDPNKAYHLIQSFAPGEISPEEAHRIGKELADQFLEGKYSYVLATHVDKNHIHNHIIFCAADNIKYLKYRSTIPSYYRIRELSDHLCYAHNKSVIHEYEMKGKSYNKWRNETQDKSWESLIRKDINECVKAAYSYDDFISRMRAKGYEIEGEGFSEGAPKYISFRPPGKDRFVRGRDRSLGKEYTKERIKERIEERAKIRTEKFINSSSASSGLIDTSDEKYQKNPALNRWAQLENFKRFAKMYAELGRLGLQTPEELNERLELLHAQATYGKESVIELQRNIRSFAEILALAQQYKENKKYDDGYQKSKDPDRYYRMHKDQLTLVWGAKTFLENAGINLKTMNVEEMQKHYDQMIADKDRMRKEYRNAENDYEDLIKLRDGFMRYMDQMQEEQKQKDQKREI